MKRRSLRSKAATRQPRTPMRTPSPEPSPLASQSLDSIESPKPKPKTKSKSKLKRPSSRRGGGVSSLSFTFNAATPSGKSAVQSISDLRGLVVSRLNDVKRNLEHSHNAIVQEHDSYRSRLHKRVKLQTHACQQMMEEAEREYKKLSEQISESQEAMMDSYKEFIADAQSSASRVCKHSIPEILQSFKKAIDAFRSRSGVQSS